MQKLSIYNLNMDNDCWFEDAHREKQEVIDYCNT